MSLLHRLIHLGDAICERVGHAIAWLSVAMVVVTFAVVLLRYVFDIGSIALQESIIYMHALIFMLGAAYTLKSEGHVRIDIFYRAMSPRSRAWVNLLGTLLMLMPVSIFIFWVSWEYVAISWELREGSREAGGLDGIYLLKSVILLMAGLLIVQGIVQMLRAILILSGKPLADHVDISDPGT